MTTTLEPAAPICPVEPLVTVLVTSEEDVPGDVLGMLADHLPTGAATRIDFNEHVPSGTALVEYTTPHGTKQLVIVVHQDHQYLRALIKGYVAQANASTKLAILPDALPWLIDVLGTRAPRDWGAPVTAGDLADDERRRENLRAVLNAEAEVTTDPGGRIGEHLEDLQHESFVAHREVLDIVDQAAGLLAAGLSGDVGERIPCDVADQVATGLALLGKRDAAVALIDAHLGVACAFGAHAITDRSPSAQSHREAAEETVTWLLTEHHNEQTRKALEVTR